VAQLADYDVILYSGGDLHTMTLGNGDFGLDPSPDIQLLTDYLDLGDRGLFLSGDGVASDLLDRGALGQAFLNDYLGVSVGAGPLPDLIGGQLTPEVLITPQNPVFSTVSSWIAWGGCPGLAQFDAVEATAGGQRLAVFADPAGQDGGYAQSAGTANQGVGLAGTSRVFSLPYDFMNIWTDPEEGFKADARLAARAHVLRDIMLWMGFQGYPVDIAGVPDAAAFSAVAAPNPFNPLTNIRYTAPRPGRLTLKVFDLRGRLVRTLLDRQVEAAGSVAWDGTDARGAQVASGVYFYEARLNGEVQVGKLALIK